MKRETFGARGRWCWFNASKKDVVIVIRCRTDVYEGSEGGKERGREEIYAYILVIDK